MFIFSGVEMPHTHNMVLDVDCVVQAMTAHLQGTGSDSLCCPCAANTLSEGTMV